jgi:hypothetical protein
MGTTSHALLFLDKNEGLSLVEHKYIEEEERFKEKFEKFRKIMIV